MSTRLAPCLDQLRTEVNAWRPDRDKRSDGWLGDAAHAARTSDHNIDEDGSVNAFDFDADGIDAMRLVNVARADHRTTYVIFRGIIYRRDRGWRAERYAGANPHNGHVHVSASHDRRLENDTSPWGLAPPPAAPTAPPTARRRRKGPTMPIIYHAGGYPPLGVLAHNGAWVTLASQEEYNNLVAAGVQVVWVEQTTLDGILADARA